jgi:hypothetical protein
MSAYVEIHALANTLVEIPDHGTHQYVEVRGIVAKSGSAAEGIQDIVPVTRRANGVDNYINLPGIHEDKKVPLLMIDGDTKSEVFGAATIDTGNFKIEPDIIRFGYVPEYNTKIFLVYVTIP